MSNVFTNLVLLDPAPDMPDAACIGRHTLFDERRHGEPTERVIDRHAAAARICATCPELAECSDWVDGLSPRKRPAGVIAGHIPPAVPARGRPRRTPA